MTEEEDAYEEYDAAKAEQELDDENRMEKMRDDQEEQMEAQQYGYPRGKTKESIFSFFKKIISLADSSKVANVTKYELGAPSLSVRAWQELASYCAIENLDIVSLYCMKQSEIVLATSLSKDGFLDTLAVSQRREIARGPRPVNQTMEEAQQPKKKWSWGKQKVV